MDPRAHWEKVYRSKRPDEVSWYRPHLETSLDLIAMAAPDHDASIIDVGGGESTLVDDLVARGFRNVSVLDVASTALDVAKERLGASAGRVALALRRRHDDRAALGTATTSGTIGPSSTSSPTRRTGWPTCGKWRAR